KTTGDTADQDDARSDFSGEGKGGCDRKSDERHDRKLTRQSDKDRAWCADNAAEIAKAHGGSYTEHDKLKQGNDELFEGVITHALEDLGIKQRCGHSREDPGSVGETPQRSEALKRDGQKGE